LRNASKTSLIQTTLQVSTSTNLKKKELDTLIRNDKRVTIDKLVLELRASHCVHHLVESLSNLFRLALSFDSGVASGGTRPGARQHTFCCHLKTCFKQKFRPNYA